MLVSFDSLLDDATAREGAVGAFTAYNLETATAVLSAAEEASTGVMLLVSEHAYRAGSGGGLVAALRAVAERSPCPCCVQLDHVSDLDVIKSALSAGVGAVMADGSKLEFHENVALVRRACALAARTGAHVEAELGHVGGDEEIANASAAGGLTDPGLAAEFIERTGAHCLAVSIGNVHGRSRASPLDWPRLEAIHKAVPVALSLHGASGIADADVRRSVAAGVRKVNVNTELRERYFAVLSLLAPELVHGARLLDLSEALVAALGDVTRAKLELLSGRRTSDDPTPE